MTHPDSDRSIYGYIENKTSTLTAFLLDLKRGHDVRAILKIRYPKDSIADNQVFIEEYVLNGWVKSPKGNDEPLSNKDDSPGSGE